MAKTKINTPEKDIEVRRKECGIIMPIAPHNDYPHDHWKDVRSILFEAIEETEFEPSLVSDDPAIGLIHERIVKNIYYNDMVICDVSSKNPNVMFELGLRLAFDKPTIIIKDEKTGYSFDTGVIEHINYPSSLRFGQIVDFKKELINRINATYEKSRNDVNYSPFLKSFGKTIVPSKIHQSEIPESKYLIEQISLLRNDIKSIKPNNINYNSKLYDLPYKKVDSSFSTAREIIIDNELDLSNETDKHFLKKTLLDLNIDLSEKSINVLRMVTA